ncbi:MAG: hypothetical protein IPN61_18370 [Bacteroidetes bacterium]|nr:hypothetical protein [Bacteroidota bacterium]MBK9415354.1 hypothetical protein [Bacteroidota bacterium]
MKKFFLLYILLTITNLSYSQRSEWVSNKSIDNGSENRLKGMVSDNSGNIYVTGSKRSINNDQDIFICKYNSSGNLIWEKVISSTGDEYGEAICIDPTGNIYITGGFRSDAIDFDPGINMHFVYGPGDCFYGSSHSYFLAKYDNDGNFEWVRSSGSCHGSGFCGSDVAGRALTIDNSGNILLSGFFSYYLTFGTDTIFAYTCGTDIFVAKFSSTGTNLWAFAMGSPSNAFIETADAIKADAQNNIYITGNIFGIVDFDPSIDTVLHEGSLYLAKYSPDGQFIWAIVPTVYLANGTDLAIDDSSNIYLSASFRQNITIDTGNGNLLIEVGQGGSDALFEKFSSDGELIWYKTISSLYTQTPNSTFYPNSIQLDSNSDLHIIGTIEGKEDLDPGPDSLFISGNNISTWVKFDKNGNYENSFSLNEQSPTVFATKINLLNDSDFYIGGFFWNSSDFAPGCPENFKTSTGSDNIFIAKYLQSVSPKIFTDTLSQTICSDDSLNVSYSLNGTFNTGNLFIAQLSDQYGHFENPIILNSVFSVDPGTINCHLPDSILPIGNYRIRVVSTDPIVYGCDNSSDIYFTQSTSVYIDKDSDSYDSGDTTICFFGIIPTGYSLYTSGTDCNDYDNTVFQLASLYKDNDQDGYDNGIESLCIGGSIPTGYSYYSNGNDCNDLDNSVFQIVNIYIDMDQDGYDAGIESICMGGNIPFGYSYITYGTDCNDLDATINYGAIEILCNGVDENCNGNQDDCPPISISLKVFIQGYYNITSGKMDNNSLGGCLYITGNSIDIDDVDTISISLMDPSNYSEKAKATGILKTDGSVTVELNSVTEGYYYILISHRNSISIWTAYPFYIYENASYDLSVNPGQVYESNLALLSSNPEVWGLYSGEINNGYVCPLCGDGIIESADYSFIESSFTNNLVHYSAADLSGDGKVDSLDISIIEYNLPLFIKVSRP